MLLKDLRLMNYKCKQFLKERKKNEIFLKKFWFGAAAAAA